MQGKVPRQRRGERKTAIQAAAHILTACITLADNPTTSHLLLINMLEVARLLIQNERRLREASRILEVCMIAIRDVESCVKMLVARARMRSALSLIDAVRGVPREEARPLLAKLSEICAEAILMVTRAPKASTVEGF